MKTIITRMAVLLAFVAGLTLPAHAGVSSKKTALIDYLSTHGGDAGTPVGVQVDEYEIFLQCNSFDRLEGLTGKAPAILGVDLLYVMENPAYESYLTDILLRQTAAGGIVTMSWHWRNPLEVCVRGEHYECTKKPMSDAEMARMLTPGTPENARMNADIDTVSAVLKRLEARGVVILWRPLHEMNGGWFWWGKSSRYPDLWDALYERVVVHNGVTNLIWVWGPDKATDDIAAYVPRRHRPDFIGADVYATDAVSEEFSRAPKAYRPLIDAPFAFTEVGIAPSQAIVSHQKPAWILLWGGDFINADWANTQPCPHCNTERALIDLFARPQIITRDELPETLRLTLSDGVNGNWAPRGPCDRGL